jgi:predicted adenylyl cyclase CyaB
MSKAIEVEIRILLSNRKKTENKLKSFGAKVVYASHLVDYWICPKNARNYKEASIDHTGYALRIRESKDLYSGRSICSLECKTLSNGKDHSMCNEYEIPVDNAKEMRKILESIGLKEFLTVDKKRIIYKFKGAKFCFDEIKGLGNGLEVEIMTRGDIIKARTVAYDLALSLGVKKEEILEKSLTYLAMQKLSRF